MGMKTRKKLTIFWAFHKKGSVVRLYMKRKDGRKGLIIVWKRTNCWAVSVDM